MLGAGPSRSVAMPRSPEASVPGRSAGLERTRVIAEGAGALSVATALSPRLAGARKVVCIVSGGNIDPAVLSRILVGEAP